MEEDKITDPVLLKETAKRFSRAFFITLDQVLQVLKDRGKLEQTSFNPVAGKIDPFDILDFKCDLKLLRDEKMRNLASDGIIHHKIRSAMENGNVTAASSKDVVIDIMEAVSKSVFNAIDNSYPDEGHNFGKFIMFSFFKFELDDSMIDKIPEEDKEVLEFIIRNNDSPFSKGMISEDNFMKEFRKERIAKVIQNPNYCTSTIMFTLMDRRNSVSCIMDYNNDSKGNLKLRYGVDKFYKYMVYSNGRGYDQNNYKLADILPIEESSIKLLELCS